jgi:hypothetical protein
MSNITRRLNKVLETLDDKNISQVAYDTFVKNTPVGDPNRWKTKYKPKNYKPGNARRKTVLKNNEVQANYPYAQRLNEGYSSQAPNGMTEPTVESIRDYVYKTLGIKI